VLPAAPEHHEWLLQNSPEFGKPLAIPLESVRCEFGNKYDHNLDRDKYTAASEIVIIILSVAIRFIHFHFDILSINDNFGRPH
jgi:hypothetical protein